MNTVIKRQQISGSVMLYDFTTEVILSPWGQSSSEHRWPTSEIESLIKLTLWCSALQLQIFTAPRLAGFFVWGSKNGLRRRWNISISCISHKAICSWGKHISSQSSCFLISGLSDPMPRCYLWSRRWHHNDFTIAVSNFTPNSFHVPELNWSILKGTVRLFLFVHVRSRCFTVG